MSTTNKSIFENIVTSIDEAINSELGEEREYSDETNEILDDVQTMLKEALDLPPDYNL